MLRWLSILAFLLPLQVQAELTDASPLGKALELISKLKKHVAEDGVKEQEAYRKYKDWCQSQTEELQRELATEKKAQEKMDAEIYEAEAVIASAAAQIQKFVSQVARSDAKLNDAREVRDQEKVSFEDSQKSLSDTIKLLDKAGEVLAQEKKEAAKTGLLQVSSEEATHVSDLLLALASLVDATALAPRATELMAFAQLQGQEDARAPNGGFQSRSGDLIELLKDMQDEAEKNLADLRKTEAAAAHTFKLLSASLKRQLDDDQTSLAAAQKERTAGETRRAKLQSDRTGAGAGSNKVGEALSATRDACMQAAADQEASDKGRTTELRVLEEAYEAIKGAASEDLAFLQIASQTGRRTPDVSRKDEMLRASQAKAERVVVGLLGRLAKQQQLPILAQLAGKVSAAFGTEKDPLAAARKMVQDLILKMQDQITSEAEEHGYCEKETSRSEARISSLKTSIKTLSTEIDQASSTAAVLGAAIDKEREELSALAKQQVSLTGSMDSLKKNTESSKAELKEGLQAVRFVMDKLKTFYGSKQSLLQEGAEPVLADTKPIRRKEVALMAESMGLDTDTPTEDPEAAAAISDTPASTTEAALPTSVAEEEGEVSLDERAAQAVAALQVTALVPPPPAPKQHAPSISSGTSIIRVLELCESELAKNLAQLDTQAGDEETEQRELLKQSMILQKQKELDVERNTREVKAADNEVRRLKADLEAAKNELEPLEEYYEQVKQRCAKKVTREDIMKKRQREIEGLKEALAVLEGETGLVQLRTQRVTSFLQRRMEHD